MKNRSIIAAIALSTTALSSVAPIAYAQDYDDEVIVTATRRAESIQDIPIAVTAIQPAELERQGIVNIQNLAVVAPSFSSSNAQTSSGTVVLRIRGVGTTSNNIGFESAVGVFVDGAYQSRPGVALGEFVDVERVEVLRGPQGTLFGRNTSAGALNITNVRPNLSENGGFLNATYGNYDHLSVQGAVNLVLAEDKVAARLTGALRNREGFVDIFDRNGAQIGESNELDQYMLRGQVGWEMDNGFKGRVIADVSESTGACCSAIEIMRASIETGGNFAAVGLGQRGGMSNPIVALDPSDTATAEDAAASLYASSDIVPSPTMEQAGVTVEIEYPVSDNMDAIYIGSYRKYEATENYDSDFTGLDIFNVVNGNQDGTNIDTMTHELRVQGDAMDGALSWLVGAYYSDESIEQNVNFELGDDYGEHIGALFGGGFGPNPLTIFSGGIDPSVVSATNAYTQDSESWSIFTHNTFDVTDALSLTVGLRYSDESKTGGFNQPSVNNPLCLGIINGITSGSTAGILAGAGLPAAAIPGTINSIFGTGCFAFTAPADLPQSALGGLPLPRTFNEKFEDNELIYTAKLGYDITPDISTYASFTHGYKSGGFNLDSTAAIQGADPSFASEEVDAFELGMKGKFLDNRVTLNVAAFMQEFTDFQVLEFTGAQFTTFNVPKAETKGVEIETLVRATDALTLNGGLTMLKAEYPDDCAGTDIRINVTSLCGNTLTNAPKTVGIAGATYVANLGDSYKLTLNGQARYESDRRTSTQAVVLATQALNPFDIQESNVKINARAAIGDQDDIWSFEAWATNLTNEVTRAVTFNTVLRGTSRSAFVQEPAMYGVTARRKF